jgi:hypothetical protein
VPPDDPIKTDLGQALGADDSTSPQCFTIYVPNKDRDGRPIPDQQTWVEEAIALMCEINGGATAMPPVDGAWKNEKGEVIRENPVVVYSYVAAEAFTAALPRVREFLHRLGRRTDQGEIAVEFNGRFYHIRRYDPEGGPT